MPPRNVAVALLELFHVPFDPTVTRPVKILVTAAEFITNDPVVEPLPMVVDPATTKEVVKAFSVNVPWVTVKPPLMVVVPVPVIVAPFASSSSRFPKEDIAPLIA
jgi:hypothetical protein